MTTIAGRYEIDSEIGRGGMGVVYLAVDRTIGRKVALKKLAIDSHDPQSGDAVKRFMREAQLTGQLNHPDIVTLFDLVEEDGDLYLVLEYYPSRSLADVVAGDGPLPEERTRRVGAAIAGALEAAHAEGVIHRDIKPENILVGEKGAKLTDFGIARIAAGGHDAASRITKTGFYVGTLGYMAPEQIAEHEASSASDVFAAGGVLYFCLTGEDPFGEGTLPAVLYRIVNAEPNYSQLNATEDLKSILATAMAKEPTSRPTAGGLKAALGGSVFDLGVAPLLGVSPPSPPVGGAVEAGTESEVNAALPVYQQAGGYEPVGGYQQAGGFQQTNHGSQSGDYPLPLPSVSQDYLPVSGEWPSGVPMKRRGRGRLLLVIGLVLLILFVLIAIRAGVKSANRPLPAQTSSGPAGTYQSSQGFAVGVPSGWNSDFEAARKVDRFWPKVGTGGVMIHRYDDFRRDLASLDEATIMSMVRVDPVGQTQLKLDPKSVNIDRTGSYSANQAVVVTYELDDHAGRSRYSSKAYFFNTASSTWSIYEVAPKADRQGMQPSFSEIQESFKVTGPEPEEPK